MARKKKATVERVAFVDPRTGTKVTGTKELMEKMGGKPIKAAAKAETAKKE